jgi:hypothetical protein
MSDLITAKGATTEEAVANLKEKLAISLSSQLIDDKAGDGLLQIRPVNLLAAACGCGCQGGGGAGAGSGKIRVSSIESLA